ncbi:acylphosphatase [Reinekea thalattae]|uniref:acylphosphatase n=1 Tax=Reinekea thalattae TaxID=2593301 RepID=A0A5C8Z7V4_9GAMM|nr:acylphosphatase [Reinekea thalattae]TXR54032.1 acylphosphatase [Reinekea thalattae]
MRQYVKAWVYGKVQGVGYRLYCKKRARELNIEGYALNLADGRVEVFMCGSTEAIGEMIESLHEGPVFAKVLGVDVEPCEPTKVQGFMTG